MRTVNLSIEQHLDREMESRERQARRLQAQETILRGQLASSMNEQQLTALIRSLQQAEECFPTNAHELMQEIVSARGRAHIGLFREVSSLGYSIIDFEALTHKATRITVTRFEKDDDPAVTIETTRGTEELQGEAARAFLRYLTFVGIFASIDFRIPCPCAANPTPESCGHCGGLGWIIGKLDSDTMDRT